MATAGQQFDRNDLRLHSKMTWKKGESGNPGGIYSEKPFYRELLVAIKSEDPVTKRQKLRIIAEKLVECAIGGESWAIQQVADRLDGKPAQESTVTIDDRRDATDWSSRELEQILADALSDRRGTSEKKEGNGKSDPVH